MLIETGSNPPKLAPSANRLAGRRELHVRAPERLLQPRRRARGRVAARYGRSPLVFLRAAARQLAIGVHNPAAHGQVQRLLEQVRERNAEIQAQDDETRAQNDQLREQAEELRAHGLSLVRADKHKSRA